MKYWIPSQMQVGKHKYIVRQERIVDNGLCRGQVNIKTKTVMLAERDVHGHKFSADERYETLFHELTHAVLYEMKSPLTYNEKFVTKFAKLLTDAIVSAK